MSKTTINFYGVKVAVDYSYSRGYSGNMVQPPEPECVELNSVTLEGHSIDIYSLMGDDRVAELSELALHAHKEQEEIARDYAADARRDFAEHVSDDWMGAAA